MRNSYYSLKNCSSYSLASAIISKINIYSSKQTCHIQVIIIKIKNHKKITHFSLNLKNIYIFLKKYNCLSKIFHKINLKLYFNVTTHNQTYEQI